MRGRHTAPVHERGQLLIILAFGMVGLLMTLALVTDIGYAYAARQALHNAADLGAYAGADYMQAHPTGTDAEVAATVCQLTRDNFSGASWSAIYVDAHGRHLSPSVQVGTLPPGTAFPAAAAGVHVQANAQTPAFYSRVLGFTFLPLSADATVVFQAAAMRTAVFANAPWQRHLVLSNSSGGFTVTGNMFTNSIDYENTGGYVGDTYDAYDGGVTTINGTVYNVSAMALDQSCFPNGMNGALQVFTCHPGELDKNGVLETSTISYQQEVDNLPQETEPLASIPEPKQADTKCPGHGVNIVAAEDPVYSAGATLQPGYYQHPVTIITGAGGTVTLADCVSPLGGHSPGLYMFMGGLTIEGTGSMVGTDVTLFSAGQLDTSSFQAYYYPINSFDHQVNTQSGYMPDSFRIGGTSSATITLSAPSSGTYVGIALFASHSSPSNISFNTIDGEDSATISITGGVYAVYDTVFPAYNPSWTAVQTCVPVNCDHIGQGSSINTGYRDENKILPDSTGSVTINGLADTDFFQDDGATSITVNAPAFSAASGQLTQLN